MDNLWIEGCLEGEAGAIEQFIGAYQQAVYRLALSILDNPDEAEDAMQETFLAALRGMDSFKGDSAFTTWLYAIASHHCLNYLASSAARLRREAWDPDPVGDRGGDAPSALDRLPDGRPGPDVIAESRDLRQTIQNELARLSEGHRLVLVLRDVQGMSYEEIAETLGIELGTVRSRLHRARTDLKARLRPHLMEGSEA